MSQNNLKNSTHRVNEIFQMAVTEALNVGAAVLVPEFLLFALMEQKDSIAIRVASQCQKEAVLAKTSVMNGIQESLKGDSRLAEKTKPKQGQTASLYGSPEVTLLLERANIEREKLGDAYISTGSLFLAFFDSRLNSQKILSQAGFEYRESREALLNIRGKHHRILSRDDETQQSALTQYTHDLTAEARKGTLDPVLGRDTEIDRVIQILSRRKKNNPVLIGEPGVGKTVIAEGLAQKIIDLDVPDHLVGKRVLSLQIADIIAGSKMHGEFEERLKAVKEEIVSLEGEVILFIDEIHTLVGAGRTSGALDASNMLKTALARGELQCIGATTIKEYKQHIESDRALERRFQPVRVEEPSVDGAQQILQALASRYERHHQIRYSQESLEAAAVLSQKYIFGRSLPDKAVDLMDEVGALKRIQVVSVPRDLQKLEREKADVLLERKDLFQRQNFAGAAEAQVKLLALEEKIKERRQEWEMSVSATDRIVTADDVAHLVAKSTGIPVHSLQTQDFERLENIEASLAKRVVGQSRAISAVARALQRNSVGLRDRKAPIGSFFFLGPTGVGKTELAKALAQEVLGDEKRLIRFDMTEFMERHEAAKLIGSPPGFVGYGEGGRLTEQIKKQPYSVVLFDEVEKAHPDVFNLFLQILDDGVLTDGEGERVSFEHSLVIFTSNLGSDILTDKRRLIGLADENDDTHEMNGRVIEEMKRWFRPEFFNRLDDTIVFEKLTEAHIASILQAHLRNLERKLVGWGLRLVVTPEAEKFLVEKGFNPLYGARPLRRLLENEVEHPIAQELIRLRKTRQKQDQHGEAPLATVLLSFTEDACEQERKTGSLKVSFL